MPESIERMDDFFTARVDGYDTHMLENVVGAKEAYARVASLLLEGTASLLDLGCGTGLELEAVFARFPDVAVNGIDLTQAMLDELARKYAGKRLTLRCEDYFQADLGTACFDAAVSVESLHHFTHAQKLGLYRRVLAALRPGGIYIEADYMVETQTEEDAHFAARAAHLDGADGCWHIDTPCSVENQITILRQSGFCVVSTDLKIGSTVVLVATRD